MKEIYSNFDQAVAQIEDGSTLMVGGFGLVGIPEQLIQALVRSKVKHLTVISNNCGVDTFGLGLLLKNKQIDKMIGSYVGENKEFERQVLAGELDVELTPQGTLAEKIRAGGAGIPAFYTKAGVGTEIAEGKEVRLFDGEAYVLEESLVADYGLIAAAEADRFGNLIFNKTARNFNPMMASASRKTIVETETLALQTSLEANAIHTPGVYVDGIVVNANKEKPIEKLTIK